jgi:hypothetical protein
LVARIINQAAKPHPVAKMLNWNQLGGVVQDSRIMMVAAAAEYIIALFFIWTPREIARHLIGANPDYDWLRIFRQTVVQKVFWV